MKRISIIKRLFVIALIFLLSINTFGAIVSNDDGATFVTKAEFDNLVNNFSKQILDYSDSISRKIDGAIGEYLKGIEVSETEIFENLYTKLGKNVMFGEVVQEPTTESYLVKAYVSMLFQGDGYRDTIRLPLRYFTISDSIGDINTQYNTLRTINGIDCYIGYINGEATESVYIFTGDMMCTHKGVETTMYIPASGNNGVQQANGDLLNEAKWWWSNASGRQEWYKYTPNTGGWSAKMTYWTRSDIYHNGTSTDKTVYVSDGKVDDATNIKFIDLDNRTVDFTSYTDTVLFDTNANINTIMTEDTAGGAYWAPKLNQTVRYWRPAVKTKKLSDLSNALVAQTLGMDVKLYEGLPLFTATKDGIVSFSFKLCDSGPLASSNNVTFALNDNTKFSNSDATLTGNKVMDTVDRTGYSQLSNVTEFTAVKDTKVSLKFKVNKGHTYYFKLRTSSTSSAGYLTNFSDINYTSD